MKTKKKQMDWRVLATGLVCLTAIEICALMNGIDGTLMTLVVSIIGLVIGVTLPNPFQSAK